MGDKEESGEDFCPKDKEERRFENKVEKVNSKSSIAWAFISNSD